MLAEAETAFTGLTFDLIDAFEYRLNAVRSAEVELRLASKRVEVASRTSALGADAQEVIAERDRAADVARH